MRAAPATLEKTKQMRTKINLQAEKEIQAPHSCEQTFAAQANRTPKNMGRNRHVKLMRVEIVIHFEHPKGKDLR